MEFSYAIVTVSDTCARNPTMDKSGPSLAKAVREQFPSAVLHATPIIPDEPSEIRSTLNELSERKINLILTTGGTGLSKRDVTPEVTKELLDKEAPGIAQAMLTRSLNVTDMAMLSRAVAGVKGESLIVNLPGSAKGAVECFGFVKSVIPHAIALLADKEDDVKRCHDEIRRRDGNGHRETVSNVKIDQIAMRNRKSPFPMIAMDVAERVVKEICKCNGDIEDVPIQNSLNRILAENVVSEQPFPPFRASIKDGYAVRCADGVGVRTVRDSATAGDDPKKFELQNGEVVRISTGACVPSGADAVVQVEDTDLVEADDQGNELKISINVAPEEGQDIREIGSDMPKAETVFKANNRISPAHVGVLATLGKLTVKVYKRARIAILSTGNELSPYNVRELPPGHVRDSNKLTLLNLLKNYGYEGGDYGIVKDNPNSLTAALRSAFAENDFVITTGGVSMGEFDLMKEVLEKDFGATIHFGRINMKPGKPTTFATCTFNGAKKFIFALPGNPVSATVTCHLFVRPALNYYEGACNFRYNVESYVLEDDIKLDQRPEYRRISICRRNGSFTVNHMGNQISSRLNSCAGANGFMFLPSTAVKPILKKGDSVSVIFLDETFDC